MKELLGTIFEDNNFNDAESYFQQIQQPIPQGQAGQPMPPANPIAGLGGVPNPQGMAGAASPMATQRPTGSGFPG